jgi:hypothetical protein
MLHTEETGSLYDPGVTAIRGDRRSKKRYPLDLAVTYQLFQRSYVSRGNGRTIDMSSSGVALTTDRVLAAGAAIELSISWPMLLHKHCPLKLVIEGNVVRSRNDVTAIRIRRYEVRTQGRSR